MTKGKWSKVAWIIIILCFVSLVIIGQQRIKEQNQVSSTIVPRVDIQKNDESYTLNFEKENIADIISRDFEVLKEQKDIGFSSWEHFGEKALDYYIKRIDNYSDFFEFKNNYNINNISEEDFQDSYVYIFANVKNSFKIGWLEYLQDGNVKCVLRTNYFASNSENQIATGKIVIVPKEINLIYEIDEILEGTINNIVDNNIFVVDSLGNTHEVYSNELINYRTRDIIDVANVTFGDYFKNSEIIRNISGEELRSELLLNLARTFNSSKLSTKLTRLKRLKVYDGYVTFKVSFFDGNYEVFGRDNPELFNIELIANEDTVLYARTNVVTIYNLQKSVRDKVFYLGIDEKTLFDERPFVAEFEIEG